MQNMAKMSILSFAGQIRVIFLKSAPFLHKVGWSKDGHRIVSWDLLGFLTTFLISGSCFYYQTNEI
jgi:hypothetical protein